jgi:hypothetical protein
MNEEEIEDLDEYVDKIEEANDRYLHYSEYYREELGEIDPGLVEMLEHSVMIGIQENEKLIEEALKKKKNS